MSIHELVFATVLAILISANSGFAQEFVEPRYIEGGPFIIAPVDGANMFQVYSKDAGTWQSVTFADGIQATPVISPGVGAFQLTGEKITSIAAVDLKGNVVQFELPAPAKSCIPIVSDNLAVFVIDGRTYAFSAVASCWDSIDSATPPRVSDDVVLIVQPDSIAAFSAKTGKWSVAKTKIEKT